MTPVTIRFSILTPFLLSIPICLTLDSDFGRVLDPSPALSTDFDADPHFDFSHAFDFNFGLILHFDLVLVYRFCSPFRLQFLFYNRSQFRFGPSQRMLVSN
ncbi:hypothetical protein EVAR_3884_1 [Eumeta japonica]|uniref:Uncharacterized protein n=1 Tax=Eumeta variegata TaxID=151549 RepID=A0A4C1SQS7_EUMVA|nr:hypothetical protein EVAR_3884_1 [Eumeta japonica]